MCARYDTITYLCTVLVGAAAKTKKRAHETSFSRLQPSGSEGLANWQAGGRLGYIPAEPCLVGGDPGGNDGKEVWCGVC